MKHRARTSLLGRAVMWTARAMLVVCVAAWALSMFRPSLALPYPRWTRLFLVEGGLQIQRTMFPGESRWVGYVGLYHSWWPHAQLRKGAIVTDMSQFTLRNAVTGRIFVPFWIPLAASCGALVMTRLLPGSVAAGLCPTCGYDLSGISGRCPECGSHAEPVA